MKPIAWFLAILLVVPCLANFDPAVKKDGALLSEGYITIQGESHPTEFRKIELLNLAGCMDPKSPSYKSYYVRRDDAQCQSASDKD